MGRFKQSLVFCMILLLLFSLCACGAGEDQIALLEAQLADAQAKAENLQAQLDAAGESYASAQENWDTERANWEAERDALKAQIDQMRPVYQYADREISDHMVQEVYEQRQAELLLSAYFAQGAESLFEEYSGEPIVRSGDEFDKTISVAYTDDAYYWVGPNASPETAAAELVALMLKDVQSQDELSFQLEQYQIGEQLLHSRDDMLVQWKDYVWTQAEEISAYQKTDITRDMISEIIETLFPEWIDGIPYFRSEELNVALGDDMWVFTPSFRVKYTGYYNLLSDTELPAEMMDANGYVHGQGDGSESVYRYILIRSGDVWRLQSCAAMQQLNIQ